MNKEVLRLKGPVRRKMEDYLIAFHNNAEMASKTMDFEYVADRSDSDLATVLREEFDLPGLSHQHILSLRGNIGMASYHRHRPPGHYLKAARRRRMGVHTDYLCRVVKDLIWCVAETSRYIEDEETLKKLVALEEQMESKLRESAAADAAVRPTSVVDRG